MGLALDVTTLNVPVLLRWRRMSLPMSAPMFWPTHSHSREQPWTICILKLGSSLLTELALAATTSVVTLLRRQKMWRRLMKGLMFLLMPRP